MLGYVDGFAGGELTGWALDPDQLDRPVLVKVYLNGKRACQGRAWHHRIDVANAFGGPGSHGFCFDLRKSCPGESGDIHVELEDGTVLGGPPAVRVPDAEADAGEVLMFMHIPKTAGTSLREAIEANYRASELLFLYPGPPGLPRYDIGSLPVEQRARFRAVIGHYRFGMHSLLPHGRFRHVTMVRAPLQRALSHYFLLERHQPDAFPSARPGETVESRICNLIESYRLPDNLLVRYFAGLDDSEGAGGTLTEEHFSTAVEYLRTQFALVGHAEDSQAFYDELAAMCHWPSRMVEMRNVGGWKLRPDRMNEIAAVFARANSWDLRFYDEILRVFPLARTPACTAV